MCEKEPSPTALVCVCLTPLRGDTHTHSLCVYFHLSDRMAEQLTLQRGSGPSAALAKLIFLRRLVLEMVSAGLSLQVLNPNFRELPLSLK